MSLHSSMSLKAQNKRIERDQTGAATEKTLPEQIAFYDEEIRKAKSWIDFYMNAKNPKSRSAKMAATYAATLKRLEMEREIRLAKLYASKLQNIKGGAMQLAKVTK